LSQQDISFIHNDDDVVIAVNSAILLMPWEPAGRSKSDKRYWISNDSLCLKWDYFRKVLRSDCTRIYRESWLKHEQEYKQYSFQYFRPRKDEFTAGELLPTDGGLCSVSSVPTAVDLAIWLGCGSVYLLGVDHCFDGDKTHFWHYWPKEKWPRMCGRVFDHDKKGQNYIFEKNVAVFRKLKRYAVSQSVPVLDCSPISSLDVFEKVDLETLRPKP